ncbi:hypothetical protein EON63_20175, partial [archaeon]
MHTNEHTTQVHIHISTQHIITVAIHNYIHIHTMSLLISITINYTPYTIHPNTIYATRSGRLADFRSGRGGRHPVPDPKAGGG